jgi:hypothetical protein
MHFQGSLLATTLKILAISSDQSYGVPIAPAKAAVTRHLRLGEFFSIRLRFGF